MAIQVSLEEVRYVARLARLSFTEAEQRQMAADLSSILGYMQQLEDLDTSNVPPMEHVLDHVDVYRKDIAESRLTRQEALSNAPDADAEYFRVPKVL